MGALSGALAGFTTALLVRSLDTLIPHANLESSLSATVVAIVIGAALGAGFGVLVRRQRQGAGETLFWGMSYGVFWWVLGLLTLVPLVMRGSFAWDLSAAQASFPGLVGLLIYGSLTGLLLALFRLRGSTPSLPSAGTLGRGALAGIVAAWILGILLDAQDHLVPMGAMVPETDPRFAAWVIILFIGALAGLIYSAFYPTPTDGAGTAVIRGAAYGFFWWVVGALTLLPLLSGHGLGWSLEQVRAEFPTLPGFILFGSMLALFYQWLHRLVRIFLSEDVGVPRAEGPGIQVLRAVGRGAVAGLLGGGIFTFVMFQIGFLPSVAGLVGSSSTGTGLLVHFIIAIVIGMSYGLLFRRQSFDLTSALGWGLTYGFVWWILGALTLMPIFLGNTPQWSASAAALAFPALVGHLGYGAGLGLTFYFLEARDRPWWLSRSESEAERITQHKEQILSSAPAIWVLIVMIALTLPVLLGM
ncbi:MAG: hypothetical protein O6949_05130 [Chloroflexi bacterium]|nr:hypothetical protein [Chloroflexota bacterium]